MPTSEPDPEARRQPSVLTYASALLLQYAYQYPTLNVRYIAMAQLLASYIGQRLLRLLEGRLVAFVSRVTLCSPTQTRLRSDSGMDF